MRKNNPLNIIEFRINRFIGGRVKDTCYYPKRGKSINRIKNRGIFITYIKNILFSIQSIIAIFDDIDLNEFNTDRLKEYLIRSGDHLKPSSLGHRVRCVKSLFRWSHEEGYILKILQLN